MLTTERGVVDEWLSEYKTQPEASITSYAASLKEKTTLVSALYEVIKEPQSELLEPVCHQLFEFYRSKEKNLRTFTLQFLPELIWCYLSLSTSRDLQSSGCIEALLLSVYNLEIMDEQGHSRVLSFTIPSLSKPSVFHEPSTIGSMALTEGALSQHGLARVVYSGPHPQREMLTAQNRFEVLSFLLLCYNSALNFMPAPSLRSLCHMSSRLCICGYPRQHARKYLGVKNRIPVSSEFMVQLLTGIYYSFYNGEWDAARRALDDVLYRAQLELFPEPILVANAIKASLPQGAIKGAKEGIKCIQVEIAPTSSRISRNAVTSLSIRGHRWKRNDSADLTVQDELSEIAEVDEGFCSRAASSSSQSALSHSSSGSFSRPALVKAQRRSLGSRAGVKERDSGGDSCREHLSRKQNQRAMSENLELVSLKRLTLTTSQSLPKPGSHSLARTATSVFSKSFEQMSGAASLHNAMGVNNVGTGSCVETNRFSACSLQEENLVYISERTELAVPGKPQPNLHQRSPSICITLSTD
ncbi:hyccin isoform X1 [Bufo bufo]|uniref:hyccin isoform X1 n=1 Tax=Bufo bufo TaxID=8384 RepID=UPI001ABEE118|nr:hyccin isoform X1 [Bufo bufo]XP_040289605.1 hyccin isoform X1 [Bufo bufo]XP_040289606.1 hyccin isoform X1 [Bufo bufo]XP_040289608.1 hyccin isoform X1 [Bufo bufo]